MTRSWRLAATAVLAAGTLLVPATASAHDPEHDHIYANDINRGVDIFLLSDKARSGAQKLPYLNPQTQESVIN